MEGAAWLNAIPPTDFWWVAPLVVGSVGIASLGDACYAISTNRKTARIKANLDLIEASESREFYQKLYSSFRRYRLGAEYRTRILNPICDEDRDERDRCWAFLNHYELIAIGCKRGILDENFYRLWMGYVVIRGWLEAADLIDAARKKDVPNDPGDDDAYCELEALANKWMNSKLPKEPDGWFKFLFG